MSYWKRRQEETYKAGEKTVNQYFTKLEKAFNQAKRDLQKTVESFYWRYAEENSLTYAEAQKRLDKAEIGELQEFIDLAMANIGKYNQKVNNMSIKARMTRYQALETQVDAILRQLYAIDYQAESEKMMGNVYEDTYYRTWYDIDRYRGFHSQFAQIEPRMIESLLKYPFNGANFSDRLWKQKDHLQGQIMEALTTIMIQGTPPQNLAKDFAKKMQTKKFDAYRLLHTESSYVMSEATHAGYKEDGVEKYQILVTLDSKTCGICGKLDRKIYLVAEAVTGKNMPPFHPFCRCTDVPYYLDTPTDGKRVARDAEGNSIKVPENMTYEGWKRKYIDKQESKVEQRKKHSIDVLQAPNIKDKVIRRAYDDFTAILANALEDRKPVLDMLIYSDTAEYQENSNMPVAFAYDMRKDVVMYNSKAPNFELYDLSFVQAHEISHRIDYKKYHSWKNARFQKAIEVASKTVYNNVETIKQWFSGGGNYEYDMALSDIISALSRAEFNEYLLAGHSAEYWRERSNIEMELFANINSIEVLGYDSLKEIKELFPELYDAYKEACGWD